MVEVESGSDFLRNFQESIEGVDFALGVEEIGVVQRDGGLFADGGEEEEVVFVEGSAVGFVDQLDEAEDVVFFAEGGAHPGLDFEFFGGVRCVRRGRALRRGFRLILDWRTGRFRRAGLR